jgi:hypothetical protein
VKVHRGIKVLLEHKVYKVLQELVLKALKVLLERKDSKVFRVQQELVLKAMLVPKEQLERRASKVHKVPLVLRVFKDQSAPREQLVFKVLQDLKVFKVLKVCKVRQELEHRVLLVLKVSKALKVFKVLKVCKVRQELEHRVLLVLKVSKALKVFKVLKVCKVRQEHRACKVSKVTLVNLVAQHSNMFSTPIQQTQIQRLALLSLTIQHCYLRLRCILITSIV